MRDDVVEPSLPIEDTLHNPDIGAIIRGGGGLRKARWRLRGQGQRGGLRVIYFWAVEQDRLLMLLMYPKNVQANLTPTQLKILRQVVEAEFS